MEGILPGFPSSRAPSVWRTVDARLVVSPYEFAAAARLADALGCSHVLAQVLVRRGFGDAAAAREFLEAGVAHPLSAFPGLAEAAEHVLGHVRRGARITVHGDYDVDGVCSTACRCGRCARWARTWTGTCRAGSTTATAWPAPPLSASPRAARSC